MDDGIHIFLHEYFAKHSLSRTHDSVRYVEHNFVEDDYDAEMQKLLSGGIHAGFKVAAWLDRQKLEPLGRGGILVLADCNGDAIAVIKVIDIEVVKFGEITEKMCQAFLIGDGSVQSWKNICSEFVNSECIKYDVDFDDNTEILVTWFDRLYPI